MAVSFIKGQVSFMIDSGDKLASQSVMTEVCRVLIEAVRSLYLYQRRAFEYS